MALILPSAALNKPFTGLDKIKKHVEFGNNNSSETNSYHAFQVGDIGILIPQDAISEVADDLPFCQLPNTSTVLYGMANLRGNIIPIFDLHNLFNFEVKGSNSRKVLILNSGEDAIALMTSELPIRISISDQQRLRHLPPIPEMLRPFTKSSYQNNGIWLDIDNEFYNSLNKYLQ